MTSFLLDLIPGAGLLKTIGAIIAKPFVAAWRWTFADVHRPFLVVLAVVLVSHWIVLDPALRHERDDALKLAADTKTKLAAEQAAHAATILNHEQAAAQAKAAQAANLTRVAAEQSAQTERITSAYQNDIAALRARRDQLTRQLWDAATAADPSLSGTVFVPGTGQGSGGIAQASGDQELPAACTPMNLDERFVASAQALQLDALIDWVEAQSALEMNP